MLNAELMLHSAYELDYHSSIELAASYHCTVAAC
jgi:hypothetical protein